MAQGRLEGRNGDVWQKYAVYSWTQERIAEHFGVSQQRVAQIIAEVRGKIGAVDRQAMVTQSRELLEDIRRRQMELAEQIKEGSPVAVGKNGLPLVEPGTDPPVYVRDYSGYLKALAEVRATDAMIAKRFGLDAPEKIESTSTVRYEIAGIDPNALT